MPAHSTVRWMLLGEGCYEVDPAKNGLRLGQAARDEDSVRSASDGRM